MFTITRTTVAAMKRAASPKKIKAPELNNDSDAEGNWISVSTISASGVRKDIIFIATSLLVQYNCFLWNIDFSIKINIL